MVFVLVEPELGEGSEGFGRFLRLVVGDFFDGEAESFFGGREVVGGDEGLGEGEVEVSIVVFFVVFVV